MILSETFDVDRPVVGMIHLPPLPGSPEFDGDREAICERMLADATALADGGVDAVLLENFGDVPFYPDDVPKSTVAEMASLATALTDAVDVPVGINVLRNDAIAALSIAAAAGAAFVRVNVHVGAAVTDQGVLEGRAHETLRHRDRLEADVAVLADVHVKHATPMGDVGLERATRETLERGRADGVIVSGRGTGEQTALADVERVAAVADGLERSPPVFVGSGVTASSVGDAFDAGADGVIVGTALKRDGETTAPVARERVERFVAAAARSR